MPRVREFRSLVFANYDTESEFAVTLGWTRQRLNKIANGQKQPSLVEIDDMARGLSVPPDTLMHIFLRHQSPIG